MLDGIQGKGTELKLNEYIIPGNKMHLLRELNILLTIEAQLESPNLTPLDPLKRLAISQTSFSRDYMPKTRRSAYSGRARQKLHSGVKRIALAVVTTTSLWSPNATSPTLQTSSSASPLSI